MADPASGALALFAQDILGVVEGVGQGDGGEEGGQEACEPRRGDQPAGEKGSDPLPDAEGSGDEFPDRPAQPLAARLLVDLGVAAHLLELGEGGAQDAGDLVLG